MIINLLYFLYFLFSLFTVHACSCRFKLRIMRRASALMTFSNNWYNAEQPKQQNFIIKNKKYNKYNLLIINLLYLLYLLSSFLRCTPAVVVSDGGFSGSIRKRVWGVRLFQLLTVFLAQVAAVGQDILVVGSADDFLGRSDPFFLKLVGGRSISVLEKFVA